MRWRTWLLIGLLAAMCSGGSFTCFYSSDGDHHDHPSTGGSYGNPP